MRAFTSKIPERLIQSCTFRHSGIPPSILAVVDISITAQFSDAASHRQQSLRSKLKDNFLSESSLGAASFVQLCIRAEIKSYEREKNSKRKELENLYFN